MKEPNDPNRQTINLQIFADVKEVAALDRFLWQKELASPRTLSQLGRAMIEILHSVIEKNFTDFQPFLTIEEAIAWIDRRNYSIQQFQSDGRQKKRLSKALVVQDLYLRDLQQDHKIDPWEQWKAAHPKEAKLLNTQANQMARDMASGQTEDHKMDYSEIIEKVQMWLEAKKRELMSLPEDEGVTPFDFDKLSRAVVED